MARESRGGKAVASRPAEVLEAQRDDGHGRRTIRVAADRQVRLSRAAVEVLTGNAWPRRPDPSSEVVLRALKGEMQKGDEYSLPLEHHAEHVIDGEKIEMRTVVLRVGSELAPPEVMTVPVGAKLVEAEAVAARRLLDQLDGVRPAQR